MHSQAGSGIILAAGNTTHSYCPSSTIPSQYFLGLQCNLVEGAALKKLALPRSPIRVRGPFSSLPSHTLRGHPPLRHVCLHQAGCGYLGLFVGTFGHFSVPLERVLKSTLSCVWGVILLHQRSSSALAVEVVTSYKESRSQSNGSVNYLGRASPACLLETICSQL